MKNNKYDYQKNSFKIINSFGEKKYYVQIKNEYIEVNADVYKVCKASYDKLRYTYKLETAKSVLHYEDIDLAAFFISNNVSALDELWLKYIANYALNEIEKLNEKDKAIAYYSFIYEYTDSEISRITHIPRKTISYRKIIIQKNLQEKIKKFCHFDK